MTYQGAHNVILRREHDNKRHLGYSDKPCSNRIRERVAMQQSSIQDHADIGIDKYQPPDGVAWPDVRAQKPCETWEGGRPRADMRRWHSATQRCAATSGDGAGTDVALL